MPSTISLLSSLAAAIALAQAGSPPLSTSQSFYLAANITSGADMFTPPLQGRFVGAIHTGAGFSRAVFSAPNPPDQRRAGTVFYQNGTADDTVKYHHDTIVMDAGTPPFPMSVHVQWGADSPKHDVTVDVGSGDQGVQMSSDKNPLSYVDILENSGAPGTFVACNETVPYYRDLSWATLDWLVGSYDANGVFGLQIPANCVAVNLVPQCAGPLPELPAGSMSSHEFAQGVRCYDDVAGIDWSRNY